MLVECVPCERQSCQSLTLPSPRLWAVCAALLPLHGHEAPAGKKTIPLPEYVIRTALKGTIKDAQDTALVLGAIDSLSKLANEVGAGGSGTAEQKLECAWCLRKCGALWKLSLLLSLCREGAPEDALQRHVNLREVVETKWGLDGCWGLKPLVSGTEIAAELGLDLKKDGKAIGNFTKDILEWTLMQDAPMAASKELCLEWLKAKAAKK